MVWKGLIIMKKKTVYDIVNEKMINRIQEAIDKEIKFHWVKPWKGAGVCFPMNYHTMNYYKGCNLITLEPGEYITYNQLQIYKAGLPVDEAEKIKIRKGATTEQVFFFQVKDKVDEDGNIIYKEGTDKPDKTFIFRYYNVYNIKDIEGLETHFPAERIIHDETETSKKADEYLKAYCKAVGIDLHIVLDGNHNFFRPSDNSITIVDKQNYKSLKDFYESAFHEAVHSTYQLVNRELGSSFGSQQYSKEELIAEIGAAYLLNIMGFVQDGEEEITENEIAYLQGWSEHLADQKTELVRACCLAETAVQAFMETAEKQIQMEQNKILFGYEEGNIYFEEDDDCYLVIVFDHNLDQCNDFLIMKEEVPDRDSALAQVFETLGITPDDIEITTAIEDIADYMEQVRTHTISEAIR